MKALALAGGILVIIGIIGLAVSAATGDLGINIVIIFPVFVIGGILPLLSVLAFIIGSFILVLSGPWIGSGGSRQKGRSSLGGVVFIGPIPLFFGSWRDIPLPMKVLMSCIWILVVFGIIVLILWLAL